MSESIICLFEDENILAIHKPEGVPFHSDDDHYGIVQRVRDFVESNQLFPVHRLDKMTSGLMVFAKNSETNKKLSELLALKQVEKYYLAISAKKPNKKQGMVVGDMSKGRRGSYLLSREKLNPAITRFFAKSLKSLDLETCTDPGWLFVLKPETGKTHQLRVALKSLGSPILGDERYSGKECDRGYLHAYRMRFDLFGKRYDIIDEHFEGDAFSLSELDGANQLRHPHLLSWPKGAFMLLPSVP